LAAKYGMPFRRQASSDRAAANLDEVEFPTRAIVDSEEALLTA
jgi:hypothetical protein